MPYFTIETKKSKVKLQKELKISRSPKANRAVPGTTTTCMWSKSGKNSQIPQVHCVSVIKQPSCTCVDVIKKWDKILENDLRFGQNIDAI